MNPAEIITESLGKLAVLCNFDYESMNICGDKKREGYFILSGTNNATGDSENYAVIKCDEMEFDYSVYKEFANENSEFTNVIMIFRDMTQEFEIRENSLGLLRYASEKKALRQLFERKYSFYPQTNNEFEVRVDNEINYTEYGNNSNLCGFVYNVAYSELMKLHNITGSKLFDKNLRIGLQKSNTGNKLRNVFAKYFYIGLIKQAVNLDETTKEEFYENHGITDSDIELFTPEKFWFYHNGITVCSYGSEMRRIGNIIVLHPTETSIVNGAQTLTNLFDIYFEIQRNKKSLCDSLKQKEEWFAEALRAVCDSIILKTIFINANEASVEQIFEGLNTQIPIEEEDRLASTTDVRSINKVLLEKHMFIVRPGERVSANDMDVLGFVKNYLIVVGKPGLSKNINHNNAGEQLKEAKAKIKESGIAEKLLKLLEIDRWWGANWKNFPRDCETKSKNIVDLYYRYGKSYFESYVLETNIEVDDDSLFGALATFIDDFEQIDSHKDYQSFKNDNLFDAFMDARLEQKKTGEAIVNLTEEQKTRLLGYLQKADYSGKSSNSQAIAAFFKEEYGSVPFFRTIHIEDGKLSEAFSFSNATFNEFVNQEWSGNEKDKHIDFETSCLKEEIQKEYDVFVIFSESKEITNIVHISKFSFATYLEKAKEVFNKTKEAFTRGDSSLFVQASDDAGFHIRPKAVNKQDTFLFSDGSEMTKRTFWANKNTVVDLISGNNQVKTLLKE